MNSAFKKRSKKAGLSPVTLMSIIATIFMPLTFPAGVSAMNFKYMPELEWPWGYFGLWAVMLTIAVLMLKFFRRKKWL